MPYPYHHLPDPSLACCLFSLAFRLPYFRLEKWGSPCAHHQVQAVSHPLSLCSTGKMVCFARSRCSVNSVLLQFSLENVAEGIFSSERRCIFGKLSSLVGNFESLHTSEKMGNISCTCDVNTNNSYRLFLIHIFDGFGRNDSKFYIDVRMEV